jgi:hypothetical protein
VGAFVGTFPGTVVFDCTGVPAEDVPVLAAEAGDTAVEALAAFFSELRHAIRVPANRSNTCIRPYPDLPLRLKDKFLITKPRPF